MTRNTQTNILGQRFSIPFTFVVSVVWKCVTLCLCFVCVLRFIFVGMWVGHCFLDNSISNLSFDKCNSVRKDVLKANDRVSFQHGVARY